MVPQGIYSNFDSMNPASFSKLSLTREHELIDETGKSKS